VKRALTARQRESLRGQRRRKVRPDSLLLETVAPQGSLRATMAEHLRWLSVRQFSPSTVRTRAESLLLFVEWCEARSLSAPAQVTKPILERYQRYLFLYRKKDGRPLSAGTQQGRLMGLKAYFRWLARESLLLANPASELELPKRPKHLPMVVLTPDEVERILALPDVSTLTGLRDRAMLEVLYSTGMRRAELAGLTVFSISEQYGVVAIREGKGRRDRVVPIGERAAAWVRKYADEARPRLAVEPDCGALFLSELGLSFNLSTLTQLVRGYVLESGVAKKGACHLFRHVMATQMLENGADVRYLQAMLGHASLESTQVYTHVSIVKLKEIHAATHPAARLVRGAAQPAAEEGSGERAELLEQLAAEHSSEELASDAER
jgi:integrase/recombinase XerD